MEERTKKHYVVVFNPNKAYEGAEAEIASFLHVEKKKRQLGLQLVKAEAMPMGASSMLT